MQLAAAKADRFHLKNGRSIEYAVPSTKLVKRAQRKDVYLDINPIPRLMKAKAITITIAAPIENSPEASGRSSLLTC
jgi:hypothetical protein